MSQDSQFLVTVKIYIFILLVVFLLYVVSNAIVFYKTEYNRTKLPDTPKFWKVFEIATRTIEIDMMPTLFVYLYCALTGAMLWFPLILFMGSIFVNFPLFIVGYYLDHHIIKKAAKITNVCLTLFAFLMLFVNDFRFDDSGKGLSRDDVK